MPLPAWFTWANIWPVLSDIPGWIALWLALNKHRLEKTILVFTVSATMVEADEDEDTNIGYDGVPYVRALFVAITNTGQRPITILEVKCEWSLAARSGEERQTLSRASVNKKLAQGDHCSAFPHLHSRPISINSAWAIDSTGKEWTVPSTLLEALNAKGTKQWR